MTNENDSQVKRNVTTTYRVSRSDDDIQRAKGQEVRISVVHYGKKRRQISNQTIASGDII